MSRARRATKGNAAASLAAAAPAPTSETLDLDEAVQQALAAATASASANADLCLAGLPLLQALASPPPSSSISSSSAPQKQQLASSSRVIQQPPLVVFQTMVGTDGRYDTKALLTVEIQLSSPLSRVLSTAFPSLRLADQAAPSSESIGRYVSGQVRRFDGEELQVWPGDLKDSSALLRPVAMTPLQLPQKAFHWELKKQDNTSSSSSSSSSSAFSRENDGDCLVLVAAVQRRLLPISKNHGDAPFVLRFEISSLPSSSHEGVLGATRRGGKTAGGNGAAAGHSEVASTRAFVCHSKEAKKTQVPLDAEVEAEGESDGEEAHQDAKAGHADAEADEPHMASPLSKGGHQSAGAAKGKRKAGQPAAVAIAIPTSVIPKQQMSGKKRKRLEATSGEAPATVAGSAAATLGSSVGPSASTSFKLLGDSAAVDAYHHDGINPASLAPSSSSSSSSSVGLGFMVDGGAAAAAMQLISQQRQQAGENRAFNRPKRGGNKKSFSFDEVDDVGGEEETGEARVQSRAPQPPTSSSASSSGTAVSIGEGATEARRDTTADVLLNLAGTSAGPSTTTATKAGMAASVGASAAAAPSSSFGLRKDEGRGGNSSAGSFEALRSAAAVGVKAAPARKGMPLPSLSVTLPPVNRSLPVNAPLPLPTPGPLGFADDPDGEDDVAAIDSGGGDGLGLMLDPQGGPAVEDL